MTVHEMADKKKVLFVVNPIAGGSDKQDFLDFLPNFCFENNFDFKVLSTKGVDDYQSIEKKIKEFLPDILAAAGGDGTSNLVARFAVKEKIPLAVIPLGSANGLATELSIPKNYPEALQIIASGKEVKMDTLTINGHLCLHLSDIGFNARCIQRFEQNSTRGWYGYAKEFFKELFNSKSSKYVFQTERKTFKRRAVMVVLANASRYGTGVMINPNGRHDDGKFELIIIKAYGLRAMISILWALLTGDIEKTRFVKIESLQKVKILKKRHQPVHVDGEILPETTRVEAEINPGSLRVLVDSVIR
jgi:diacylglycerol kinase (ATP)